MKEKHSSNIYSGVGLAAGCTMGLFLWAVAGDLVFLVVGATLGLILGAIRDGYIDQHVK